MLRIFFTILAMVCVQNTANAEGGALDFTAAPIMVRHTDEIVVCLVNNKANFNKTMVFCPFQVGLGIEAAAIVDLSTMLVYETGLVAVGGFTYSPNTSMVGVNQNINCELSPGEFIEILNWNGTKFVTVSASQC